MQVSERGLALIKRFEGFCASPYRDAADYGTIGYGHRLGEGDDFITPITIQEADALLACDVAEVEDCLSELVNVPLSQSQYDALTSLVYNIGRGAFARSTLLLQLNNAAYDKVASEFLRWNKVTVQGIAQESPGLTARRAAERAMFLE